MTDIHGQVAVVIRGGRGLGCAIDVDLGGQMCAQIALPGMIARRRGHIINIASGGGATMLSYFSSYVTSADPFRRMLTVQG
jgi:NADP-dependent 3-hydroxy acid dehydrogenase YdfG